MLPAPPQADCLMIIAKSKLKLVAMLL